MYSIVVKVHHPHKKNRYVGYGICIAVKQDGIDESIRSTSLKMYQTRKAGLTVFEEKIKAIRKFTGGVKENEYGRCMP